MVAFGAPRVAVLCAAGVACGDSAYAPEPTALVGDRLTLRLLPDQDTEGTYALGLRVERGDSTLLGTIRAEVTNGTTLCLVEQGAVVTLHWGEVEAFP